MVGFKTETGGDDEAMVDRARALRDRVDLAFVVANDAGVMGEEETRALLVDAETVAEYAGSKSGLGARIAADLASVFA
jgi:phosphopantothenoylcysteine decarboxylase/phosphopantothenate--cysteine ligase